MLLVLFGIELFYFKIADYYNIIDKPNNRSSHTNITLRGGGIIFYFGFFIYFIYSRFSYPFFFVGLTLISIISFLDDVKPKSAKIRLSVHILSTLIIFCQWNLYSKSWYICIIAIVFCLGILNAYNFMDGINGITGGYSFIVTLSFLYINNYLVIDFVDNTLIIVLLLSLIVFNYFNFRKRAKCFAGDIGSISIAFIILFLLGKLIIATNDISYFILLILYLVDTFMTILHRLILKEKLMEAHRKHMFQIMANELKMPHLQVSLIYMFVQAIITIIFLLNNQHYITLILTIFALVLIYILFMKKYFHLHYHKQ